jgi:RHS repeat-associated protein
MVAMLSSSGTAWSVANERSFDVWGSVRSGVGPKAGYCANLGHVADDEWGLISMRARFYEPESGRFVSQDPARDGRNWFTYCSSNPVNLVDESGHVPKELEDAIKALVGSIFGTTSFAFAMAAAGLVAEKDYIGAMAALQVASAAAAVALWGDSTLGDLTKGVLTMLRFILTTPVLNWMFASVVAGMAEADKKNRLATIAVAAHTSYLILVIGALALDMSGVETQ